MIGRAIYPQARRPFTLVEIMIAVAIIGILAAVVVPSFLSARRQAQVSGFVSDLRVAEGAFEMYALENRGYPDDANRGQIPSGLEPYLAKMDWEGQTPIGGLWDWEYQTLGVTAGISVVEAPPEAIEQLQRIDQIVDDGDLEDGRFFRNGDRYTLVLED